MIVFRLVAAGVFACILLTVACTSDDDSATGSKWGPLAVVEETSPGGGGFAFGGSGAVDIGSECVTLSRSDGKSEITLAWGSLRTQWQSAGRAIVFHDDRLGRVVIEDGDNLGVGGFDRTGGLEWLVEPSAECPREVFTVTSVELPTA